jgi:hypothetical protein
MEYVSDGIRANRHRADEFGSTALLQRSSTPMTRARAKAIVAAIATQDHYRLEYRIVTRDRRKWMWEQATHLCGGWDRNHWPSKAVSDIPSAKSRTGRRRKRRTIPRHLRERTRRDLHVQPGKHVRLRQ